MGKSKTGEKSLPTKAKKKRSKKHLGKSAVNGAEDESVPYAVTELERKYVFADPTQAQFLFDDIESPRDAYRALFKQVLEDRARFPDLAKDFRVGARRAVEQKDYRFRIYLVDADFRVTDNNLELRLEESNRRLMIKQGVPVNDNEDPTLNRLETKIAMDVPRVGTIGDINRNSLKDKNAPRALRDLFGKGANDVKLYPAVQTESVRDKFVYYKRVSYDDRDFIIVFEMAQDEGEAKALGGEVYDLDQLELEVKEVIEAETNRNILENPEKAGLTKEQLYEGIVHPAFDEEDAYLRETFGLAHVRESKPQRGFRSAKEFMARDEGMKEAERVRQLHLTTSMYTRDHQAVLAPVN